MSEKYTEKFCECRLGKVCGKIDLLSGVIIDFSVSELIVDRNMMTMTKPLLRNMTSVSVNVYTGE